MDPAQDRAVTTIPMFIAEIIQRELELDPHPTSTQLAKAICTELGIAHDVTLLDWELHMRLAQPTEADFARAAHDVVHSPIEDRFDHLERIIGQIGDRVVALEARS